MLTQDKTMRSDFALNLFDGRCDTPASDHQTARRGYANLSHNYDANGKSVS